MPPTSANYALPVRIPRNLTDKKFGQLTAKCIVKLIPNQGAVWHCECSCGRAREVLAKRLTAGKTTKCVDCTRSAQAKHLSAQRELAKNSNVIAWSNSKAGAVMKNYESHLANLTPYQRAIYEDYIERRRRFKRRKYNFPVETERITLAALIDARLSQLTDDREHRRAKRALTAWSRLLSPDITLDELSKGHLAPYIAERRAANVTDQSINRELNCIRAALYAARELFPSLEKWQPPQIKRLPVSKARRERVWTRDEQNKILEYLLQPLRAKERQQEHDARHLLGLKIKVALLTGARLGEVNRIKKTDVNFETQMLRLFGRKIQNKRNPVRYVFISNELEQTLHERMSETDTEYLFSRHGIESQNIYKLLRKACGAVGVKYGRKTKGGIVFHDARHTATSRLLSSRKVGLPAARDSIGHSDATMTYYYAHSNLDEMRAASEILASEFQNEDDENNVRKQRILTLISDLTRQNLDKRKLDILENALTAIHRE